MASGESDTTEQTTIAERGGADGKEGEYVEAGHAAVGGGGTPLPLPLVGGPGVGGHWTSSQFNRMHSLDE